jgi:hypothetical protein
MKHFYLLTFLAVFACTASFAQDSIKVNIPIGVWDIGASWDKMRAPANGDVIVVPPSTKLKVLNDVNLSNVHLRVYGEVTLLNATTTINLDSQSDIVVYDGGTIDKTMANQKIKIGGVNVVGGSSATTITGPATATASAASFQPFLLPVKFVGFSVAHDDNGVLIQWSTSEEHDARTFEVERSLDGSTWNTISTVKAAGNSATLTNYSYTDKTAFSKAYYRIKQVDVDGKFVYTSVKSITANANSITEVQVASTQGKVVLQFSRPVKNGVSVRLVSLSGMVVNEQRVEQAVGQVILNTIIRGNYIVSVSNGQDVKVARQVIL